MILVTGESIPDEHVRIGGELWQLTTVHTRARVRPRPFPCRCRRDPDRSAPSRWLTTTTRTVPSSVSVLRSVSPGWISSRARISSGTVTVWLIDRRFVGDVILSAVRRSRFSPTRGWRESSHRYSRQYQVRPWVGVGRHRIPVCGGRRHRNTVFASSSAELVRRGRSS